MNSDATTSSEPFRIWKTLQRVTFEELSRAIQDAVTGEQIGVPVSVRLHWQSEQPAADLAGLAEAAAALVDVPLQFEEPVWRERRHESGTTLNRLGSDRRGRTALVTLVAEAEPNLSLTVYGNHGVVRLEEAFLDPSTLPASDA